MTMRLKSTISLACLILASLSSYAEPESKPVVFTKTISGRPSIILRPFSLVTPPKGVLDKGCLNIDLNTSADTATIIIYKEKTIMEYDVVLASATDTSISYDISYYERGDYRIEVIFPDNTKYEAFISIE